MFLLTLVLVPFLTRRLQVPARLNTADVAPAPWCPPQARATIAPVSRVSCMSCSTLVSFAIGPRLSPLLSTSRPLSRINITFIRCFHFGYWTPFAYDAVRCVASVAGRTLLSTLAFLSPHLSLSVCIAHRIATDSDNHINTPSPGFVKTRQPRPQFPSFRVRVFRGNRGPSLFRLLPYVSSSLSSSDLIPAVAIRHSHLLTRAFRLVRRQLTLAFRPSRRVSRRHTFAAAMITTRAHHPPAIPARTFSLREHWQRPGLISHLRTSELAVGLPPPYGTVARQGGSTRNEGVTGRGGMSKAC